MGINLGFTTLRTLSSVSSEEKKKKKFLYIFTSGNFRFRFNKRMIHDEFLDESQNIDF